MLNIEVKNKKQCFQDKKSKRENIKRHLGKEIKKTYTTTEHFVKKDSEFKSLSDQTLLFQTRLLAQKERDISIQVIKHLSEIEYRKLHLKRGFSSLFDYTVKELGYSHGSAYRRIKAMRLCREMPETTAKLKTGELNLTTVSQLQTFFEKQSRRVIKDQSDLNLKHTKQQDYQISFETQSKASLESTNGCVVSKAITNKLESQSDGLPAPATGCVKYELNEKTNNLKFDRNKKLDLLKKVEGKSSRQTEKLLCEVDPEISVSKEKLRFIGSGKTELKIIMDEDLRKKLETLKHLLSHKNPNMSYSELFTLLTELGLKKYDPRQKLKKKEKPDRTQKTKKSSFIQVKNKMDYDKKTINRVSKDQSVKGCNKEIQKLNSQLSIFENKNIQAKIHRQTKFENKDDSERFNKQSRYIPAEIRRFIWTRDHAECSYICSETKKKCKSKHLLQIDHIQPYALGGSSRTDNLRLLCAGHNQYRNNNV
ncbi:MAG: HNH endonuclease [Bdellovibrionales bacterium]|nr:HNH endonuclease [Bdellovibrionales bacterium]